MKPCPFCGGKDQSICMSGLGSTCWVTCDNCRSEGPLAMYGQDEAVDLWNVRDISVVVESINAEPEYPGEVPKEMQDFILQALVERKPELIVQALRLSVRLTKKGIIKRLKEDLCLSKTGG